MEIMRQKLSELYDWDIMEQILPLREENYYFKDTKSKNILLKFMSWIVIDDEDLKMMGLYDDKSDIYKIDKDLLYYRADNEPKVDKLHYTEK